MCMAMPLIEEHINAMKDALEALRPRSPSRCASRGISHGIPKFTFLVIPQKSAGPREAGWLDECPPEILRGAQDDSLGFVILSTAKDLWRPYGNHQGFWNEKVGGV